MTYKYYDVRRGIYESCSDKKLKGFRSWSEIKNLFKTFHWIMIILLLLSLVAMVLIFLCPISELWEIAPASIFMLCAIIMEYKFDPLLNEKAREDELKKYNDEYAKYISKIQTVLLNNGIDTPQKRNQLKKECTSVLEKHESKYIFANSKVFDVLIGVPIGALISSLIYKESEALLNEIIAVIFIGIIIVFIVKFIRTISFYSEGYWKDKQMLNALEEVEYSILEYQS